jgi:tRNA A-37 threonylcarbamoyl transferase component Bud32
MRTAAAGGVPVPEVLEVHDDALVLERIDGPTMLEEIQRRPWRFMAFGRELGRIQAGCSTAASCTATST